MVGRSRTVALGRNRPGYRLGMSTVTVLLEDWEHMCCGARRTIGDEVELRFRWSDGTRYETRHVMPGEDYETLSGRITGIAWRRAVMGRDDRSHSTVVGSESGIPLSSTDALDSDEDTGALEFTLDTSDGTHR